MTHDTTPEQRLLQRLIAQTELRFSATTGDPKAGISLNDSEVDMILDAFQDRDQYHADAEAYYEDAYVNQSDPPQLWRECCEEMATEMAAMQYRLDAYDDAFEDSCDDIIQERLDELEIVDAMDSVAGTDEHDWPGVDLFSERRTHIDTEQVLQTTVRQLSDGVIKDRVIARLQYLADRRERLGFDINAYPESFSKSLRKAVDEFDEAKRNGEVQSFTTLDEFFAELDKEDDNIKQASPAPDVDHYEHIVDSVEMTEEERADREKMLANMTDDEQLAWGIMVHSMHPDRQRSS